MKPSLQDSVSLFGLKSELAQKMIPKLYRALEQYPEAKSLTDKPITSIKIDKVAAHFGLEQYDPAQLLFVLQTYYSIVIQSLAACRLGDVQHIESLGDASHFKIYGISNFEFESNYSWCFNTVDLSPVIACATVIDYQNPIPDALKALYHDLIPRAVRHKLGEYYTPDWLANFVLDRLTLDSAQRLLDPACGSGTFVIQSYLRLLDIGVEQPLDYIAGIDINPLACMSAKANLILNMPQPEDMVHLPIYCADVLLDPPDIGLFDCIIGNPPWVNWETLTAEYRQQTVALWQKYGLFPHSGFETILGKGKKDLSLVLTYAVVDRYLKQEGQLAFIMTQSVLKAGGAAEGFRRFDWPDHTLYPQHVDDFSQLRIFSGAETKPVVLHLTHNKPEHIQYFLWNATGKKTIAEDADNTIIQQLEHHTFIAEPVDSPGSAWLTGRPAALQAVRKILGQSDYEAHAGAYTGGANAVYWLEILERDGDKIRIKNIVKGAKRSVKQVEQWIESEHIYPLLRGRDVSKWQAIPSIHILIVQNPETRQGYNVDWLRETYPLTYAYLQQFESTLRKRATFKRYFRDDVPFYTMFDIGEYTFEPYKVIWHGFGKRRMQAVVAGCIDGKPIMSNQAMHPFIGLKSEDEAHFIAGCLNSAPFEFAVLSHTQSGGKSFAQPGILKTLRIPKYNKSSTQHQRIVALSRAAHQGNIDDDALARATAPIWDLTPSELVELQASLRLLTG